MKKPPSEAAQVGVGETDEVGDSRVGRIVDGHEDGHQKMMPGPAELLDSFS